MSSDEENKYYCCLIKKGLSLYHITPMNIEENYEEYEFLATLPDDQEYAYNLKAPMYFGLSEYFTIYYDILHRFEHLQFVTTRDLKLIHINDDKKSFDYKKIEELGYDGWIARDGIGETWLEVMLLKPDEAIEFVRRFDHETTLPCEYPANVDQIMLSAYMKVSEELTDI